MANKVMRTVSGKIARRESSGKILIREDAIGDLELTGHGDMYTFRDQILCYRPFWNWRVTGWHNTSNIAGYCGSFKTDGSLGDADTPYEGMICNGEILLVDVGVSYAHWGKTSDYRTRVAFEDVINEDEEEVIQAGFTIDDPTPGYSAAAIAATALSNPLKLEFHFPVRIRDLFGAVPDFCDLNCDPTLSIDPDPQDPDAPGEWAPWCRPVNGAGVTVQLW